MLSRIIFFASLFVAPASAFVEIIYGPQYAKIVYDRLVISSDEDYMREIIADLKAYEHLQPFYSDTLESLKSLIHDKLEALEKQLEKKVDWGQLGIGIGAGCVTAICGYIAHVFFAKWKKGEHKSTVFETDFDYVMGRVVLPASVSLGAGIFAAIFLKNGFSPRYKLEYEMHKKIEVIVDSLIKKMKGKTDE